jgi:hypothetical protein
LNRPPPFRTSRLGAPIATAAPFDRRPELKAFRNERAFDVCLVPQTLDRVVEDVRRLRVTGTVYEQACESVGSGQAQQPNGFHTPRKQHRGLNETNHGGLQLYPAWRRSQG